MQAQIPAQGIRLEKDFHGAKWYTVSCECGNQNDEISVWIEPDDYQDVTVNFYVKTKTAWWKNSENSNNWCSRLWGGLIHRFKVTRDVWFRGFYETESCTILSKQTALNFAKALEDSVADLEKQKKT